MQGGAGESPPLHSEASRAGNYCSLSPESRRGVLVGKRKPRIRRSRDLTAHARRSPVRVTLGGATPNAHTAALGWLTVGLTLGIPPYSPRGGPNRSLRTLPAGPHEGTCQRSACYYPNSHHRSHRGRFPSCFSAGYRSGRVKTGRADKPLHYSETRRNPADPDRA